MATSLNLVLAPGVLGFDRLLRLSYFNGVAEHLIRVIPGARVLPTRTAPLGTVEFRAGLLADQISHALDSEFLDRSQPVHLLAHSMGGLDARWLVAKDLNGLRRHVATVVTLGTPHHGSPVASLLNRANPLEVLPRLLRLRGEVIEALRKNGNAAYELSERRARAIDAECPDVVGVQYLEVVGVGRRWGPFSTSGFFAPTSWYVGAVAGSNDGIVPRASATRNGRPPILWRADHADLIGHDLDEPTPLRPSVFPHLPAFVDLVRRIVSPAMGKR